MRQIGFVETDWEKNIKRVSPLLGILLVIVFALFMFSVLQDALQNLTQAVTTDGPDGVTGTVRLVQQSPVTYGDIVSFRSTVQGAGDGATTYVTTTCFQGNTLVYQRSAQQGVSFYLSDLSERDLNWNGGPASCSATLLYRTIGEGSVNVFILDALSFEVAEKKS